MAHRWGQHTLWGNNTMVTSGSVSADVHVFQKKKHVSEGNGGYIVNGMMLLASQRSLHDAPIFRLLLKVAVNGTHQCDFHNFCGASGLQQCLLLIIIHPLLC